MIPLKLKKKCELLRIIYSQYRFIIIRLFYFKFIFVAFRSDIYKKNPFISYFRNRIHNLSLEDKYNLFWQTLPLLYLSQIVITKFGAWGIFTTGLIKLVNCKICGSKLAGCFLGSRAPEFSLKLSF